VDLRGKSILITGGAGFIGSHIVDELLKYDVKRVIVYDNFSSGRLENLGGALKDPRVKVVRGSILNIKKLMRVVKAADIISHQAAQLEIISAIINPDHDLRINIQGTLNVLKCALRCGVKKVIYASSAAVYGQAQYLPQDENHPLRPHWPYGVSKLAGERYCIMYSELYNLNTVSLRYGIVYGPREWYGRVLTIFTKRVLDGQPPIIFGDGNQTRDFIHVKDVARINVLAIENDDVSGEVFNVGSGVGIKIKDLAYKVIKTAGRDDIEPTYADPKPFEMGRKPGELRHLVLDIKKAQKMLGFKPSIDFDEGLQEYIEWARKWKDVWWRGEPRV